MVIKKDTMKNANNRSVFQTIINKGPISRNEVSQELGLNKVTVSNIINDLMKDNFISSIGEGQSTTSGGRRPELVQLNAKFGFVANFSVTDDQIETMANKFDGRTLEYTVNKVNATTLEELFENISDNLAELPDFETENGLCGISIAIPGYVYRGNIIDSPFESAGNFNLQNALQEKFDVPVVIENASNLSAIFEQDFSQQELVNIVSLTIGKHIGAGILINRQLYKGYFGRAGDVGHMIFKEDRENVPLSQLKPIEDEWSEQRVKEKLQAVLGKKFTLKDMALAYSQQNPEVSQILDDFCYHISLIVNHLIIAFDPQMIFFNSKIINELPDLLRIIQLNLSNMSLVPPLVFSKDVHFATLLGGCSLVIHNILDMEQIRLILHH
ncbi:transcriptional regulator sugar kinase, xylose operon regulator [Paucilactobacillus oligofermentans DSM 15707 = LMG 22743]|uniref:Transcriptional regulator sugar kinase, xylose operon regulator n=1 Tax=Paucilactobacillus oligofermentans DSM 15707 = LMG 22743 TaxID=1423778 RepID=A0A0R1RFI1_9LACO|nr:ROK family transcriptional regulator [Paucilactobacillus oligofermentans]KRL55725.1 transcriptional regulator sugar kinase, xylose operon regulator [Paucilactobacillus oligofermentans DSM 15707 = LMG 22743]CUS27055.1 Xylose repressor [Paucilactobacillus oligofermentans DSM 15707 = LMG 22743]